MPLTSSEIWDRKKAFMLTSFEERMPMVLLSLSRPVSQAPVTTTADASIHAYIQARKYGKDFHSVISTAFTERMRSLAACSTLILPALSL